VSKVRVCFLGTPDIAVTCLSGMLADPHFEIVGVITQPEKPAGRKMQLTPTPVHTFAKSKSLNVISPPSVNTPEIQTQVGEWRAEVAVVVAFGQIVSPSFLDLFPQGCVNVHASLLPRWRGAAPIQRAVQAGDKVTGVCLQKMVKKLDAGDVIGSREFPINDEITALELLDEMGRLGVQLLRIDLMDYLRGNLIPTVQNESLVTYAKKIEKTESEIKWAESGLWIHNTVRALTMGPGTWTLWAGQKIKIHKTRLTSLGLSSSVPPGSLHAEGSQLFVKTADAWLEILELQPESRNRQNAAEFLRGQPLQKSARFGA